MRAFLPFLFAPLFIGCNKTGDLVAVSSTARDVTIRKVTFNQAVSITMRDAQFGVPPDQHDVIAYRPGLVRVHVDVDLDVWEPREIAAVLTVDGGPFVPQYNLIQHVESDSLELERDTTFDFEIAGEFIRPGSNFHIDLREIDGSAGDGSNEEASFSSTEGPWNVRTTGTVTVRLIPIQYNADGSGRLPDTSAPQVELYRARMAALYPTSDVRVDVGQILPWEEAALANGSGWETLLGQISAMRASESSLPANTYFYGVFSPSESEQQFCSGGGCVLGLSNFGTLGDVDTRSSIGLGFTGASSAETMVHEVGHAHGRLHAPCGGAAGVDPDFPSSGAGIGAWGWDINSGELLSPGEGRDLMGYCSPIWVSGYTWQAFAERIAALDAPPLARRRTEPAPYQRFAVEFDGEVVPIGVPELRSEPPVGQLRKVEILHDGVSKVVNAHWFPSSHLDSGMLLLETKDWGADSRVYVD